MRSLLRAWFGKMPGHIVDRIILMDGGGHSDRQDFFTWLSESHPLAALGTEVLWEKFRDEFPSHVVADPAAGPLLQRLSESGLQLGLLTNGRTSLQLAKLEATGLAGHFTGERIITSQVAGAEKPDLRAFQALTAAISCSPERTLYIGDHPEFDIKGAKEAGFLTCWLRRRRGDEKCAEADLVVDSLAEITPYLFPIP